MVEPALGQFDRVLEEMRKLSNMVDQASKAVELARGIEGVEARRAFHLAAARLEEAAYWFGVGLRHAERKQ